MRPTILLMFWSMRPAGGSITVTGTDEDGATRKFTQIPQVYRADAGSTGRPFFFVKNGDRVELG